MSRPKQIKKSEPSMNFSALKLAWELGYTMTIPLVLLALAGRFLDKHYDTSPLFLLGGVILSIIISTFGIYRTISPILKSFSREGDGKSKQTEKTTSK